MGSIFLSPRRRAGHSLLETIIATSIFVVVAVALSGVWLMYARGLSKSAENMAASFLARSVTEGLKANGWDWLKSQEGVSPLPEENYEVERIVRGREADIKYNVTYEAYFNTTDRISSVLSNDLCRLTVTVRWRSANAKEEDGEYNNEETYVSYLYKEGMD